MELEQTKKSLDVVDTRQKDIIKMETGIRNLRDMLVDMSTLLDVQVGLLATSITTRAFITITITVVSN